MAVGRITAVKGYDTLIRAFALLGTDPEKLGTDPIKLPEKLGTDPIKLPAKLVIIGDADEDHRDYLDSLKRLATELGVADRVVFSGGQTHIPECLSLADVVVSSNVRKPESFGLSVVEALMMNRPVVARSFGGVLDIVRPGIDGALVVGTDPWAERFADAISRVLAGSGFDKTPNALRKSASERFSRESLVEKTISAYEELLSC